MRKLGILAGGGRLPIELAERCATAGRPVFVIRMKGFFDHELTRFPGAEAGVAELGRMFDLLRQAGCEAVCFAGIVKRPNLSALKPDFRGLKSLPGALSAAREGDDALLRFLVAEFEREGFTVEGADAVDEALTLQAGPLGKQQTGPEHAGDLARAVEVARAIGRLDIGQSVVVAEGLVLAVEAQEGTDALLARTANLPQALRGTADARKGVLVKWPKPIQERRVDLPTIGVATVEGAAKAGLAGIAGEARGLLVLERAQVIAAADQLGLFIVGLEPGPE